VSPGETIEDQSKDVQGIAVSTAQVEDISLYPGQERDVSELNQSSDDQILNELYKVMLSVQKPSHFCL
jgi:hypothetical protein